MEDYKIDQIVQKVYELSKLKKLNWSIPKKASSDYFVTNVSNNEIAIFNTGIRYVIEIYDRRGNLLDSKTEDAFSGSNMFYSLKELYEIAKSDALKIEENLNNLLDDLNSL